MKGCALRHRLALAGVSLLVTAIFSTTGTAEGQSPAAGEKAAVPANGAAGESLPQASAGDGRAYPVTEINLRYAHKHSQQPDLESIMLSVPVSFGKVADGLVAPRPWPAWVEVFLIRDMSFEKPVLLYASGIKTLCSAIVADFNRRGLSGVFVGPDVHEIDERTGADLRTGADRTKLDLVIYTATIKEVRTVASGGRITGGELVNNPAHASLKSDAPLKGVGPDNEEGNLLRKEVLDDYVFSLNRFPGRHVDAALSSTGVPGDVVLDLLVNEEKPWLAYAQLSNTGTKQTSEWRESAGVTLTQLANNDDILSLNYTTTSFDTSHAVTAAYEFDLSRDGRLRMRPYLSWSRFDASDVGISLLKFTGEDYQFGDDFIWNVYQYRQLFVDLVAGARLEHVYVDNESVPSPSGSRNFLIPKFGPRLERFTPASSTSAAVTIERSIGQVTGSDAEAVARLGRPNVDYQWWALRWDVRQSLFLDTLLASNPEQSPMAHEVSARVAGQYAFHHRLPPQFEDVLGGFYTVRGYPENSAAGDSDVVGSVEYALHIPRLLPPRAQPSTLPVVGKPFRYARASAAAPPDWDLIVRTFVDAGYTNNSELEPTIESNETLLSTGVGAELRLYKNFSVRLDWGVPLRAITGTPAGDSRFHFALTVSY
jgi:hemolysin activation/secretion protein